MGSLDNPRSKKKEPAIRLQPGLSRSAGGGIEAEGRSVLQFDFASFEGSTPFAVHAILNESKKVLNPKIRFLYLQRALFSVGDERGRTLGDEELELLSKYVFGKEPLTDEDLARLDELVPDEAMQEWVRTFSEREK